VVIYIGGINVEVIFLNCSIASVWRSSNLKECTHDIPVHFTYKMQMLVSHGSYHSGEVEDMVKTF